MIRRSVQGAVVGGIWVAAAIAPDLAAPPANPAQTPARQVTVAESGVRFRLGPFFLGADWIQMTLIIENERSTGVRIAAVDRGDSGEPRVTLSDGRGASCQAAKNPAGIAAVADPGLAETPAKLIASMTELGPGSQMTISLRFPDCRLSKTSRLSLLGEFAVSPDGEETSVMKVPFWGIEQRTTIR